MKLVDILAREFKDWPVDDRFVVVSITQDDEGELNGYPDGCGSGTTASGNVWDGGCLYLRDIEGEQLFCEVAEDRMVAVVTPSQWQAAVDALKDECNHLWIGWGKIEACELCSATRKIEAWNGNGRPPVGEWCEILSMPEPKGAWCKGKILYISNSSCVWCWDEKQIDLCANTFEMEFRPIRTPEQIEQEKQQDHWLADVAFKYDQATADKCAAILVDAGYRKQVKP